MSSGLSASGEVGSEPLLSPKEEGETVGREVRLMGEERDGGTAAGGGGLQFLNSGIGEGGAAIVRKVPKPPTLVSKLTQAVLTTPLHPVRFVHVLIQLGHEPVPPERRYSLIFRRYMYYWPGLFGYARAIARQDGWRELYRGWGGSLATECVNIVASSLLEPYVKKFVNALPLNVVPNDGDTPDNEDNIQTTRAVMVRGARLFVHKLVLSSCVTIIIQPFYTIAVRMIAEHVGKEAIYTSVWTSLQEIYREEGLAGFYKGTIPALLGGVLATAMHVTIWIGFELAANMIAQVWGKTLIRNVIRPFMISYVPRSYSYPFELMRAVMSVNNSRLAIGTPPQIPIFNSWRDSFWHLKATHLMYRGSVFYLPRYAYTSPPQ